MQKLMDCIVVSAAILLLTCDACYGDLCVDADIDRPGYQRCKDWKRACHQLTFDIDRGKIGQTDPVLLGRETIRNRGNGIAVTGLTFSKAVTTGHSWDETTEIGIKTGTEFSTGFPGIVEGKISLEGSLSESVRYGESKQETITKTAKHEYRANPGEWVEAVGSVQVSKLDVPYKVCTLMDTVGDGAQLLTDNCDFNCYLASYRDMSCKCSVGTWKGVTAWNIKTDIYPIQDTYLDVPDGFTKESGKYCQSGRYGSYDSIQEATVACIKDIRCKYVEDKQCTNDGPFHLCRNSAEVSSVGTCLYRKGFIATPSIKYRNIYCRGQFKLIGNNGDYTDLLSCAVAVKAQCPIKEMLMYTQSRGACFCLSGCNDPSGNTGYNIYRLSDTTKLLYEKMLAGRLCRQEKNEIISETECKRARDVLNLTGMTVLNTAAYFPGCFAYGDSVYLNRHLGYKRSAMTQQKQPYSAICRVDVA